VEGAAYYVALQACASDLDLGQLGHAASSPAGSVVGGRREVEPRDDREVAVRRLGGGLLGFLLRAAYPVAVQVGAHPDLGGEGLHVVGALVLDDVLGHAEAALGGELLQGGLPVEAGAELGGGLDERVEEHVHERAGGVEATAQLHVPDHRLDGVGEDEGLHPATGRLLAATELDVVTKTDVAADLS